MAPSRSGSIAACCGCLQGLDSLACLQSDNVAGGCRARSGLHSLEGLQCDSVAACSTACLLTGGLGHPSRAAGGQRHLWGLLWWDAAASCSISHFLASFVHPSKCRGAAGCWVPWHLPRERHLPSSRVPGILPRFRWPPSTTVALGHHVHHLQAEHQHILASTPSCLPPCIECGAASTGSQRCSEGQAINSVDLPWHAMTDGLLRRHAGFPGQQLIQRLSHTASALGAAPTWLEAADGEAALFRCF